MSPLSKPLVHLLIALRVSLKYLGSLFAMLNNVDSCKLATIYNSMCIYIQLIITIYIKNKQQHLFSYSLCSKSVTNSKTWEQKRNSHHERLSPPLLGPQHKKGAYPDNHPPPVRRATPLSLTGPQGIPAFLFHTLFAGLLETFVFLPRPPRPRFEDCLLLCNGSSVSKSLGVAFKKNCR